MSLAEIIIIAGSLSMDAMAVAICKGACMRGRNWKESILIAFMFGFFQAAMPLIGWTLGSGMQQHISAYGRIIAFVLLTIIGVKLIRDAVKEGSGALVCKPLIFTELIVLAFATSIDAMAAGFAFAALDMNIWLAILLIGAITFLLSYLGTLVGCRFGAKYQSKAQLAGGITLALMGLRILAGQLSI
ncbi:MAG: manganese efflux pump MntP family protein [Eubacteriales bacterium]|jgi:putative Mn2+ efflux pump MntP|nr:manganese efflux pump MntP family protein [Eubacteriales bacterium]MDD3109375.1 manganese efflux pump MntP family protein [Eubacteriales bacterium]MDD3572278.1 manganese efflux pump MntP family protein [Eubacteriales bacterium]MDD4133905.1 manganese efflux pump MntP family protein [Eubacteriales bacterium]NLO14261.1 manganese efflux pump [Clostridiales bacterium]